MGVVPSCERVVRTSLIKDVGSAEGASVASRAGGVDHPLHLVAVPAAAPSAAGRDDAQPSEAQDRYADAVVIAQQVGPVDADGYFSRVRLVQMESKHPFHRVEETLREEDAGPPRLLRQYAMAGDHILVVLPELLPPEEVQAYLASAGLTLHDRTGIPGGYLVGADDEVSLETVPALLEKATRLRGGVLAEPNYVYWHASIRPDDPEYGQQWALERINMPEVWGGIAATSTVVVAVFDTGTTLWHPDLYDTRWINEDEVDGNETDDDGNGYIDDRYGWDFYNNTNDPSDMHGHGTHVHGTIGAAGNNARGISGVGWHIRTLPVAFMGPLGHGYADDAASGLYYVQTLVARGVPIRVTNHSWGGGGFSAALSNAFVQVSDEVLHVAAAGNTSFGGTNNDGDPFYPASFAIRTMVAVANSTDADRLHSTSHYGASSVHLAAPGTRIRSTLLSGGYGNKTGSSMAAPHVAGVLALLMDAFPGKSAASMRAALLEGVQPVDALGGVVATGGRLDALGAFLAAGPVLEHEAHPNVDADVASYEISAHVRPGPVLLAEEGVRLYWDTTPELTGVTTNVMSYGGEGRFVGEIPGRPEGNRIYYWIEAVGLDGKRVTHPATAPAEVHAFDVTFPVAVYIQGLPGAYGEVTPGYGAHQIAWGSQVAFETPLHTTPDAGSRWRNIGWHGAGSIPATGQTNQFAVILRQTSYLAWRWRRQYALEESTEPTSGFSQARWWDLGGYAETAETSDEIVHDGVAYRFVGWKVDGVRQTDVGTRAANPAAGIFMDRARAAVAHYVPAERDSDGDGLPDWWQLYNFGHLQYGAEDDPDGDGFTNAQEYADRSDPTDPASYPEGPAIAVATLPEQIHTPGPWRVQAVVTDRVDVAAVLLYWRQVGEANWQTVRMDAAAATGDVYEALLASAQGPGVAFEYKVFAEDVAWNATTSSVYRFAVDYPVLSFGALDHAVTLTAGEQQLIRVAVTNHGTSAWHWQASYGYAEPVALPAPAGWTSGGRGDQWHVSSREYASAPYAWFCGDPDGGTYNHSMDASLYSPFIRLGSAASLRFQHWPEMEHDGRAGYEAYYWDGAVVELSTDGGASFFPIEPEGGYPHRITPNPASPFEGHRPCFGGTTGGWHEVAFDLADYSGESVQVRFRFGTDRWMEYRGWFVDDIVFSWEPDWLVAESAEGTIAPGASGWITWQVDASERVAGTYQSAWALTGNAPLQPRVAGEVVLQVRPPPPSIGLQEVFDDPDAKAFVVRWHSETGRVYSLLSGTNLPVAQWRAVPGYTNLAGTGGEMSYTGRIGTVERQFYRIEESEP